MSKILINHSKVVTGMYFVSEIFVKRKDYFQIPNYSIIRDDHTTPVGGTTIFLKTIIKYTFPCKI